MNFKGVDLVCPDCRTSLTGEVASGSPLRCENCASSFPVVFGIPDLRLFPDPYISLDDDRVKARRLAERFDELSFQDLVAYYYSSTSVVPPHHARLYTRSLIAGMPRAARYLDAWEGAGEPTATATLLDVGCGTAPLVAAAAGRYRLAAGVDVALRWLVVARKRLAEAGFDAPIVCANAEALPFRDETFDRVVFDSSLEHVRDQRVALAEAARTTRDRARIFVATPNCYSLGPDPQTGIPAGAFLPDGVVAAIVRRQGGIPPKRQLLSRWRLERLLHDAGFRDLAVDVPDIAGEHEALFSPAMRFAIRGYRTMRRYAPGRKLLTAVGPLLMLKGVRCSRDAAPR